MDVVRSKAGRGLPDSVLVWFGALGVGLVVVGKTREVLPFANSANPELDLAEVVVLGDVVGPA